MIWLYKNKGKPTGSEISKAMTLMQAGKLMQTEHTTVQPP